MIETPTLALHAPTPAEWRRAMSSFPTGVMVVTSWSGREPMGSTVNAFCSVSLEPPLLLVCLATTNPLLGPVRERGVFGLNILGARDGEALARRFAAGPEFGRFEGLAHDAADGGAPRLDSAVVFIDCVCIAEHEAGDHVLLIGRGAGVAYGQPQAPLLYHRGVFPGIQA
jgi:3-hydroxy-9,10-secoandrosta-1,3,5(10)-triene-9,17-dione monooxygenase reductase component